MAMKYRKKPVVVEAIQWTGKNLQELKNFVGDSLEYDVMDAAWEVGKGPVIVNVRIQTLEGIHHASVGDFIIKGIRGEFYPCKPDIFAKTYESASLTPPNEWVSVEERLPEDEARQYIEDDLDGIGYLYPCLLTYKSPNTERIHVVRFYYDIIQKWFVDNGEELCEKGRCIAWMPLPAPYDHRPPEGEV